MPDSRVVLSSPLERSPAVSTFNTSHISPVLRSGVVILRPSVSRECRRDQFDGLVPTQQHAVQFPLGWRACSLALPAIIQMANMSPTVLLHLRSYANPGIGVIVWPLQHPTVLPTSALAAMARTELQSAQLTHPSSPAHHLSVLLTLHHLGPAASPVVCRLAPRPCIVYCY